MSGFIAWVVRQPVTPDAAWWPLLWVAFGLSGVLLFGWATYVMRELDRARKRYHEVGNDLNWLNARLYFIEQKLGLPTPPRPGHE